MTPTEQDKELQEKLLNLRITVWKQTNLNGQANLDHDSVDEILQLIAADRKRVALEARIEEWKSMGDFLTKADKRALSREFLDLYRLHGERLKAEREEV